ncbi:protein kinase [Actinomadura graeca]|uniref:non-specific serine/threonine protein kinase n=1 Tax=Actinomadura graeca TaxID=2750812 RepID=A0ABX8QQZ9_9ACTN|nr:protein kinase [Actinomadura graeca]QXJ21215.1 protein kinase [Actinomadura graeca]
MAVQSGGGRFERVRKLGEGGMGSVWLAWDSSLERNVAVKEMHTGVPAGGGRPPLSSSRVLREARAASRLRHPNIVQILELIESADAPLIVMEYIEGESLAEWITRKPGALSEDRVAEIGIAVLDALIAAHAERVVHRDIKPANILIQRATAPGDPLGPRVRLIDFGNAAIEGHQLTTRSSLIGTLAYVAPERFSRASGPEVDLWSLGVTLYQAMELRLPFARDQEAELIYALLHEPPDPMARAGRLAPVIVQMLDKDPGRRLDARTARDMLRQVLAGPVGPPPPRAPRRTVSGGSSPRPATTRQVGQSRRDEQPNQDGPAEQNGPAEQGERDGRAAPADVPPSWRPPGGFAAIVARNPKQAAALLREQGPRASARVLDRLEPGSDEALSVVTALGPAFAAEVLGHTRPETAVAMLRRLDLERAVRLLVLVPARGVAAILAAMRPDDRPTARLLRALPPGHAARVLNDVAPAQAIAVLEVLEPARTADVLARMSPRRAAVLLDQAPGDPRRAAVLVQAFPRERLGGVLDRMDASRVAEILLVHPGQAAHHLQLMRPAERQRVIDALHRLD